MEVLNYSEARANFAHMLDKVNDDRAPILITRQGASQPPHAARVDGRAGRGRWHRAHLARTVNGA